MADPFSILAAVETCLNLATTLVGIASDFKDFGEDSKDLYTRFQYDDLLLRRFLDFFRKSEAKLAEDINHYVRGVSIQLLKQLEDTTPKVLKYRERNIARRAAWPFVKSSLNAAEEKLSTWVNRLNICFIKLPFDLQQELVMTFTSQTYQESHRPISGLIANIAMKRAKSQGDAVAKLQDLHVPKKDEPGKSWVQDNKTHIWIDNVLVPPRYVRNAVENEKIEFEVAKLVKVLQDAGPTQTHIPKAGFYFAVGAPPTGPEAYGIVYELPAYVIARPTLKELIKQSPEPRHVSKRRSVSALPSISQSFSPEPPLTGMFISH